MDGLRSPNGGGGGRPRPFAVAAFWEGFVLAENRGETVTRAQVSRGIVVCTHAGVPGLLAHDEWGASSFPSERHPLCPENGAEWPQQGQSRYGLA